MTLSLAFLSPRSGGSRDGGSASARVLHQAPDRPSDALVRAMGRHRTVGAGSGSSRTPLIHPASFRAPRILLVVIGRRSASASVRETEFCGLRLAGEFRRRTRENGGNSVRRSIRPIRAAFSHPRNADLPEFARFFDFPVEFGRTVDEGVASDLLEFSNAAVAAPLLTTDPKLPTRRHRGSEQVELNQGAAQGNHKRVRLYPRAIDRGIPNDQIEPHRNGCLWTSRRQVL